MIGEVKALLDKGVDIDKPVLAGAFARVQQHVLDDGIGTLAVLDDLVEIAAQSIGQFVYLGPRFSSKGTAFSSVPQFVDQSMETAEKLLTKLSGFLISWAMPAVSWPSEASFCV